MEVGSLAEWVEGGAEILAVSVALFLPYYQTRKNTRAKARRVKQVIIATTRELLDSSDIPNTNEYRELTLFVSFYGALGTNDNALKAIGIGNNIVDIIDSDKQLSESKKHQVKMKIHELKNLRI